MLEKLLLDLNDEQQPPIVNGRLNVLNSKGNKAAKGAGNCRE